MRTVAVTGANGFVGRELVHQLQGESVRVRSIVRNKEHSDQVAIGNIGPETQWREALDGVDVVVHTAARVHVMGAGRTDLSEFRNVNVAGTRTLAEQAATVGVQRVVFLSTVKVLGEWTIPGEPFKAGGKPDPKDAYSISKFEAEEILTEVADRTGIQVVIVRPPLVYGPGVKGNFRRIIGLVSSGVPLPLGAVDNRRSLVALDNLVDFLKRCIDSEAAASERLLVSDGVDLSTPQLVQRIAGAMNREVRLVPVPVKLLRASGRVLGLHRTIDRLVNSLEVDSQASCNLLNWMAPVAVDEAIRKTVSAELRT